MNENIELRGDELDDYRSFLESEAAEREDAHENAPELPEWTDVELDDFECRAHQSK